MTLAGALEISSRRTLPFFWDDASDFAVLEKLAVSAFNNVLYWWCIAVDVDKVVLNNIK